jgi:hypothetical protein
MEGFYKAFFDYEKKQKKTIRGDQTMYDIKGYHKYLNKLELFNYYLKNIYNVRNVSAL